MKKPTLTLTCILIFSITFSQKINYKKFTEKTHGCDSLGMTKAGIREDYDSYNTLNVIEIQQKNLAEYYNDYAMVCYKMFLATKETKYIFQSIDLYQKALNIQPDNYSTFWNIACDYTIINNCEKAKSNFDLYKKNVPKKYLTKAKQEEVEFFLSDCNQKN